MWSALIGDVFSTAAVANGVVYLGSPNFNVYAFDAISGRMLWTAVTDSPVQSEPVVANGVLYVTASGSVYAFGLPPAEPPARPDPTTLKPETALPIRP